ncbi:hypothetical protein EIP86_002572 [Pleurotus ostreatoroseus]|nr:hypothetical protein EIP86_002572 [Pleurotus ostreatoroseus]
MRAALAALALLPASALATITITGPSPSSFWVQNTSNVITWTFTQGDPSPVDILVINSDNTTLNGAFDIAQFVDVSIQSVTITNVTLKNGSNYQVEFVNPLNASQIYATSQSFSVMPNGSE